MTELSKWAAHFVLEHEEFEAARMAAGGQPVYIADDDAPDDLKNNAVMSVF